MSPVPIYTSGWRETKWSEVPCLRKQRDERSLKPGPPDPEVEVLTSRSHTPPQRHFQRYLTRAGVTSVTYQSNYKVASYEELLLVFQRRTQNRIPEKKKKNTNSLADIFRTRGWSLHKPQALQGTGKQILSFTLIVLFPSYNSFWV